MGGDDKRRAVGGAEKADAGLDGEGEGVVGGVVGGVGEFEGRSGGGGGAEVEGEIGRVAGDDGGDEGEAEDGDGDLGSDQRILVPLSHLQRSLHLSNLSLSLSQIDRSSISRLSLEK